MNEMYIISFNSTHQAIKCDKLFGKNEMDYTVLPHQEKSLKVVVCL